MFLLDSYDCNISPLGKVAHTEIEENQQHAAAFLRIRASAAGRSGTEPPLSVEHQAGAGESGTTDR